MDEDFTFDDVQLDYPSNLDEVGNQELEQFQGNDADTDPAAKPATEERDWKKAYEDLEVRNAQMESRFEQYQRHITEQFNSLRNPPQHQGQHQHQQQQNPYGQQHQEQSSQNQQWKDPYAQEVDRRFQGMTNQLNQVLGQFDGGVAHVVRQNQQNALKNVLAEFPDFHEYIPADKLNNAFNGLIQQRNYGLNWEAELRSEYFKAAGPTLAKKLREQQNEVATKREQKAQQNLRAAQAVTPGGARYQSAQEPTLKKGQRGFKDAREGFMAALERNGVGG